MITGRTRFLYLMLAAIAVAGATLALLWWAPGRSIRGQTAQSAGLVPENAFFYLALDLDPTSTNWLALRRHLQRLGLEEKARDLRDETLHRELGLEWERDVAPFLGGEAAVFPAFSGAADIDGALLLRVRDRTAAIARVRQALDKQATQLRTTVQTETYDGTEVHFIRTAGKEEAAAALVGDYIVLAERRGSILNVIDVHKGRSTALASRPGFREMQRRGGEESLLFGYVDGANLWASLQTATRDTGLAATMLARSLGLQRAEDLGQSAGAFFLRAEKTGLRLEGLALLPAGSQLGAGLKPYQAKLPETAPAEALLFISGYDLYTTLARPLLTLGLVTPAVPGGVSPFPNQAVQDALAGFKRAYGIDLDEDFLRLLTKEYALSLALPSLRRPDEIAILFTAEVSDPDRMGVTLRRLGQAFERQGLRLHRMEAGRTELIVIEQPGTRQNAGYALRGAHFFFGYQAQAVRAALQRTGGGSLAEDSDYLVTISALPDDRLGLFYLSLRRLIMLLQDVPAISGALTPAEWRNLGALRGLAATSSFRDNAYHFSLVITLESDQ